MPDPGQHQWTVIMVVQGIDRPQLKVVQIKTFCTKSEAMQCAATRVNPNSTPILELVPIKGIHNYECYRPVAGGWHRQNGRRI